MPNRHAIRALTLSLMTAFAAAHAGTVSVVTSFPKELTDAYKKAFEARNPTIKIEILNKNTTASIAYIKELPPGQRPDIMWASAPDAFEVLARDKLLQPAPEVKNPQAPAKRTIGVRPCASSRAARASLTRRWYSPTLTPNWAEKLRAR